MKNKEIHRLLAAQGFRFFALSLDSDHRTFIHRNKSVKEWRDDIRRFISEVNNVKDEGGYANDEVYNSLTDKLMEAGYCDVNDIVADVYEGRTAVYSAGIEDNPSHEEQTDGFGHYGWELKDEI